MKARSQVLAVMVERIEDVNPVAAQQLQQVIFRNFVATLSEAEAGDLLEVVQCLERDQAARSEISDSVGP